MFSAVPGAYTDPQSILSNSDSQAWIIYNLGGNWQLYTGAFTLTSSSTIQAIAIGSSISALTAGTYSTSSASMSVSIPPVAVNVGDNGIATVSLGPLQTQLFTTTVTNTSNIAVTWSLSQSLGSISSAGTYTALFRWLQAKR